MSGGLIDGFVADADEALLRSLLAIPENLPIIRVLNDVLGGPIDDPNFATWRAVDADAIRQQGLTEGSIDTGLYCDLDEQTYAAIEAGLREVSR